jgi:glycosyltransferase involved in cell wall biosynthesis
MLSSWADRRHHRLEKAVLRESDAVIAVSPGLAEEFSVIHPREYHVITNGYDEADLAEADGILPGKKFSLVHIGSLVPARNPVVLWKVLAKILAENPGFRDDLEIKLVGKVDYTVRESLEKEGLTPYLNKVDYVPHQEVGKIMKQSQVLLLLVNNTPNARGILTGKFFEYLGSGRPVLAIGPVDGDLALILRQSGAGMISDFGDENGLMENLREMYSHFKNGDLSVNAGKTEMYSRKSLTAALVKILDSFL